MKWINLGDRQPNTNDSWGKIFWKNITSNTPISSIKDVDEGYINTVSGRSYKFEEIAWLDESESIHDWGPRLYTQEEVDLMLSLQHRNTRHDAIDIVLSELTNFLPPRDLLVETMCSNIQQYIMNMEQRKP
jgi:hypothetical protein